MIDEIYRSKIRAKCNNELCYNCEKMTHTCDLLRVLNEGEKAYERECPFFIKASGYAKKKDKYAAMILEKDEELYNIYHGPGTDKERQIRLNERLRREGRPASKDGEL